MPETVSTTNQIPHQQRQNRLRIRGKRNTQTGNISADGNLYYKTKIFLFGDSCPKKRNSIIKATQPNQPTVGASTAQKNTCNLPHNLPMPESGFEPLDILLTLLCRARGVSQFLVNECHDYHSDAAGAINGMLDQGINIVSQMETKSLERATTEQEVGS